MHLLWKITQIPREIKWFFQRGKRGYADCDLWDMDMWFAETVVPMLKQLKKEKHGYPSDLTEQQWDNIMDNMIYYFTEMQEDKCSLKNPYEEEWQKMFFECDWNKERTEEEKDLEEKFFDFQNKIDLYRDKQKDKGFKLFSEHFWSLWD